MWKCLQVEDFLIAEIQDGLVWPDCSTRKAQLFVGGVDVSDDNRHHVPQGLLAGSVQAGLLPHDFSDHLSNQLNGRKHWESQGNYFKRSIAMKAASSPWSYWLGSYAWWRECWPGVWGWRRGCLWPLGAHRASSAQWRRGQKQLRCWPGLPWQCQQTSGTASGFLGAHGISCGERKEESKNDGLLHQKLSDKLFR